MQASPQHRRTTDLLAWAYLMFAVTFALHTTYRVLRDYYATPHFDDWRIFDEYFSMPLQRFLIKDQNGHRLPVTLLLMHLDYTYLKGQMALLVTASLACIWLAAFALTLGLRVGGKDGRPLWQAVVAFSLFCLFWSGDMFDLIWGVNQGSQQCRMLLAVALTALALGFERRRRAESSGTGSAVIAGLASLLATFSQGIGAASWAAVGLVAIVGRFPRSVVVGLAVSAAASVGVYSISLGGVPFGTFYFYTTLWRSWRMTGFAVAFVGGPIAHLVGGLGLIGNEQYLRVGLGAGIVGLAGLSLYGLFLWRRAPGPRDLLALGFMSFVLAGGFLVALNRVAFPDEAVSIRFLSFSTLFWIGAAVAISSQAYARIRNGWVTIALLWVLCLAMIPSLFRERQQQRSTGHFLDIVATMHMSEVQSDPWSRSGRQTPELAYRIAARFRSDQRSFFADGRAELLHSRLDRSFDSRPATDCVGEILVVRSLEARGGPAAMVFGRVSNRGQDGGPPHFLITDADGVIQGFATLTQEPFPEHMQGSGLTPEGMPWVGFVNGFKNSETYVVHSVGLDSQESCEVARWPRAALPSAR